MAGTNKKRRILFFDPIIILKNPQLPENIGMVARTMVNFGFKHLRIVNPKVEWPNSKSIASSAGAFDLIRKYTKVYHNLKDALQGINLLCAATVRERDLEKKIFEPRKLIRSIQMKYEDKNIGFLFGAEKSGLSNNDLSQANLIVRIPTNEGFGSLNLAMAVNILCYEWFLLNNKKDKLLYKSRKLEYANKDKVNHFSTSLIKLLYDIGFYKNLEKNNKLSINLKNFIANANLSEKDLKILFSILRALIKYKNK